MKFKYKITKPCEEINVDNLINFIKDMDIDIELEDASFDYEYGDERGVHEEYGINIEHEDIVIEITGLDKFDRYCVFEYIWDDIYEQRDFGNDDNTKIALNNCVYDDNGVLTVKIRWEVCD